jgi:hypothetical protein
MKNNIYLEAPNQFESYSGINHIKTVFLAGSITGESNWQINAKNALLPHFNIFNPRRENYDNLIADQERIQIAWEYKYLDLAGITLFYFSNETLAPITLLEYGKQLVKCKYAPFRKTYVTIHPEYKRKNDVIIQTELENPLLLLNVFDDLNKMYQRIISDNS